ncbi:Efflux transporter, RND family, MFP subunit [Halomonas sp. A3H3]|uniref:efflux RND transporter periplasmic adaptor subunit n=1 Tax=Halomonas sp. A3H3 TaxID=1346287 RepID=UPI00038CB362|nr:HlyD family efflux transporter periplasmic adaptor subunit [Halomonas sp. A3H3]CDG56119.1 Efflux transporter, RND family, MFP subunit [Halomonas sp. A3H3]
MTRKRMLPWVLMLLVAAVASAGIWLIWLKPVEVRVAKAEHDVPITVFGLGTIEAEVRSDIGFETGGTLVELLADHGDSVKRGEALARLDSREQEARVAQAKAAVQQAEAAVAQAAANVERADAILDEKRLTNNRVQALVQRGTTSQQLADEAQAAFGIATADLAQARSAVTVAQAFVEQTRAALALEETRLARYRLHAPYDALVIKRHRQLGSSLNANETVFTLVDPATIWALAYIDEARAGAIEVGQPAEVIRRSASDLRMPAEVVRIEIESDRVNEEYRVYVRCRGCPLPFHLGEQAEIRITAATLPIAHLVRMNALANIRGNSATAWTVEDGRLHQRQVRLGHRTLDGRVEIVSGVPEGARLVDGPTQELQAGRKVTIVDGREAE